MEKKCAAEPGGMKSAVAKGAAMSAEASMAKDVIMVERNLGYGGRESDWTVSSLRYGATLQYHFYTVGPVLTVS